MSRTSASARNSAASRAAPTSCFSTPCTPPRECVANCRRSRVRSAKIHFDKVKLKFDTPISYNPPMICNTPATLDEMPKYEKPKPKDEPTEGTE